MFEITEVSTTAFKVNTEQEGKVFVFGKEVQDFHTVDYEALSMLNISATQELLKRIESLEGTNKILKADITYLKNNNNELKTENENQGNYLKNLDQRLQQLESQSVNTIN